MLGSVVEGGSTITFRMLERSDFVDEQELAAFDFIKQHYRAYGELPLIETIEEECDLAIPETPEHVDYYLQKLHDRTVYNGVREEFSVLRDSLKNVDVTGMMTSARNISRICTPYTGQQAEIMTLAEARRLVKEAYRHNHANIGLTGIPTGHRYLNEETGGYQNGDLIVWVARPGVGKSLAPNTKVIKHNGSITEVQNIRAGDMLLGPDSKPRKVLGVHKGREEMFRVTPVKGESWECNRSHILSLRMSSDNGNVYRKGQIINLTIDEYLATNKKFKHHAKLWRTGVEFPQRGYTVDPYIVGLWIGDGEKTAPVFATPDKEVVSYLRQYAALHGYAISQYEKREGHCPRFAVVGFAEGFSSLRHHLLNECVVGGEKRIPTEYLVNSRRVRLDILAGLLDTDGYMVNSMYEITTKYGGLKDDILYIARSLGLAAYASPKVGRISSSGFEGDYWRITISGDCSVIPCKVLRKQAPSRLQKKNALHTGFTLESVGEGEFFGVELGQDHLYLLWDFTVTHNTHLLIHGARAAREAHKSVLFVSMEMPLTQIAARYVAHAAGLDPDKIRKGKLSFWAERTLSDGLAELGGATNFHLFAGNFKKTSDDVDVLIQELAPDIVYIDGMYLLHPSQVHGRAGRYERAAYLTDEIKRMTLMRDRPIVCSSQFGRGANKGGEDGSLENIGYTDAIGTHSSIVIGVKLGKKRMVDIKDQKEDGEIYTKGQKETYPYRHHEIMKGREGETGEFATHFAFAPTNFSQVPVETAIGRRVDDEEAGRPSVDHMQ